MNILVNIQDLGTIAIINLIVGIILTPLYFIDVLRSPNRKRMLRIFWIFFIIRVIPYPFIFLLGKGSLLLTATDICLLVFLHKYYDNYVEQDYTLFNEVHNGKYKSEQVTDERFKEYGLNKDTLMNDLFEVYSSVEVASNNLDDEKLQKLCGESMYKRIKKDLDYYQKKKQKKITKNLIMKSSSLEKIIEKEDSLLIHTKFTVSFCEYVIKEETGKVVDGDDIPGEYTIFFEFIKKKDSKERNYILNDMFLI